MMQVKGEHKIGIVSKNGKLTIDFALYAGDNGHVTSSYESQREVSITITKPNYGGTGDKKAKDTSADYVYYWMNLNLDRTLPDNIAEHMGDYSLTMSTGNFMPWLSNTMATANLVSDIYSDVNEIDRKMFEEYKDINKIGTIVDLFNLYYVSAIVRESGKIAVSEYRIYPSYRVNTRGNEITKECIENFNRNFSEGGVLEKYAKRIEYDENNPITEDDFVDSLDKIDGIVNKWCDVAGEEDEDIDDATRRLDE